MLKSNRRMLKFNNFLFDPFLFANAVQFKARFCQGRSEAECILALTGSCLEVPCFWEKKGIPYPNSI